MRTRVADLYLGEIDGKEGSGNGEELLWHARSRRHGHRFLWFLLHLKGLNVVLRAEPVTKKVQEPKKVRIPDSELAAGHRRAAGRAHVLELGACE